MNKPKLQLYNTLTRKIEEFKPEDPAKVKIYTCGPTVYNYQHIGNYTAYIYWDLLLRVLRANGYNPERILNLTDVGHLASDADEGEDKLEKGARREGKSVWEIAEFYAEDFLKNYRALNLLEPAKITRATDYIKQDQQLVDKLFDSGYIYEITDGLYFDTSKFPTYADFAHLDLEKLQAGARVEFNDEKRHASDFAVWKFIQPGEDHAMQWEYRGRAGYPGWHLECSTIIHEELDEPIDIHTGGIDHIPVHHTNEVAQSEAAYGHKLANYWLHCNFITIDGEKISKSLGNVYTLQDLQERGFSPMDFKMWVLQGHYQSERSFSFDDLAAAQQRRLNWRNRVALLRQEAEDVEPKNMSPHPGQINNAHNSESEVTSSARNLTDAVNLTTASGDRSEEQYLQLLNENLNSAAAFAAIDNSDLSLADWACIDELFGLNLIADSPDISDTDKQLITQREQARQAKDYATADTLRDQLATHNLTVLDTENGPIWQYLK